jgi:hypothetical protein
VQRKDWCRLPRLSFLKTREEEITMEVFIMAETTTSVVTMKELLEAGVHS